MSPHTPSQAEIEASAYLQAIHNSVKTNDHIELDRFHTAQTRKATETGHAEGMRGIPGSHGNSPFESELIAESQAFASDLATNKISLISRLAIAYNHMKDLFVQTRIGNMHRRIQEIIKGFNQAKTRHDRPGGETDAIPWLLRNQWMIYLIIIIIGACEVPLNNTVFQAFRLSHLETVIITIILVLAIPILAHFGGKCLKRFWYTRGSRVAAISILALFTAFSISMGLFRYVFFQATDMYNQAIANGEDVMLSEIMSQISYRDALGASEFWVGFIFNLILLAVGLLLGYFAHDSNGDFESHYCNYHLTKDRIHKRMNQAMEQERRDASANAKIPPHELHLSKLSEIAMLHEAVVQYLRNLTNQTNFMALKAINTYRTANIAARPARDIVPDDWNRPYSRRELINMPEFASLELINVDK